MPFDIQCYDERFKGPDNPESVVEIYVPIVSQQG
jgi:predicted transcriptional regulator YdeE